MYRVALLESDEQAMKVIETSFNWKKYDMQIVGSFSELKNLAEYLKTNDVDVIFADITPPNAPEFEFIDEVRTRMGRDDILFVIVSECVDYEFMRKAIRLGVADYCKKPVERKKTDEVLAGVTAKLKRLGKAHKRVEGRDFDSLLTYINENYDKPLRLEDLSRKFYFNPNYLCMLFRRRLDTTFIEYIKSIRMNKAKELFDNKNITVSEVSAMVGYRDYSYFHKTFSAYFGVTPAQYKKKVLKGDINNKMEAAK